MRLNRSDVIDGLSAELASFTELVAGLTPQEWAAPTRCTGWSVADVAAHIAGNLDLIVTGRLEEFTRPEHVAEQVALRQGRGAGELADELRVSSSKFIDALRAVDDAAWAAPLSADVAPDLGTGVENIWADLYIHLDDVNAALGRPSVRGPGLRGAVGHLADQLTDRGWGPATLRLDGLEDFDVSGGGAPVTGDPVTFVLAATGRTDPTQIGLDDKVNIFA